MLGRVRELGRLPDRRSAEQATRAVLQVLAERLPGGLADHLAAQLPPGLGAAVHEVTGAPERAGRPHGSGDRFGLEGFAGRVAAGTGTSRDVALRESVAVLAMLDEALTPGVMAKVANDLPSDVRGLLPPHLVTG
jgi:uncharacterized protein (DUF2267 family)